MVINSRVVELLKSPDLILNTDLKILNDEILKYPYIQNIRVLHLFGTHQFASENYTKELSKTAAYTTDKKNLYQFINKKATENMEPNSEANLQPISIFSDPKLDAIETPKLEITSKIEEKTDLKFKETETIENFNEENIFEETTKVETTSELSFHGIEAFLPEIKIIAKDYKAEDYKLPSPKWSKQEEEMQRLIAEVEEKVKNSKKEKVKEDLKQDNIEVNFFETQNFEIPKKQEIIIIGAEKPEILEKSIEFYSKTDEKSENIIKETISVWKPMSFSGNMPDSLIPAKKENKNSEKPISEEVLTQKEETKIAENIESNIPIFINTWQNWLKIDRNLPKNEEKTEIFHEIPKNKAIEIFIEKEPKISKLKENTDFVVKEKGDNISHLITETLANLYANQKLYAKAIKAYEILIEKHPQKKNFFETKIQEIKEIRKSI